MLLMVCFDKDHCEIMEEELRLYGFGCENLRMRIESRIDRIELCNGRISQIKKISQQSTSSSCKQLFNKFTTILLHSFSTKNYQRL